MFSRREKTGVVPFAVNVKKVNALQKIKVPVLLGPTASGKSDCALKIARELGLEIVSCDSRQIYRGMDIGTAKPPADVRREIRHWLVDSADPGQIYSGFQFAADSLDIIRKRHQSGQRVLVCGGTGFYFRCLSMGLSPRVAPDPEFRAKAGDRIRRLGAQAVHAELMQIDPESGRRIHPNDTGRLVRAIEIFEMSRVPPSALRVNPGPPEDVEFCLFLLLRPREEIYRRIGERANAMMRDGLWDEFTGLRRQGWSEESPGMLCVGYRELFAVERNECSLEDALENIKQNTRRFAKRQMTWLRTQVKGRVIEAGDAGAGQCLIDHLRQFIDT
jgi:tRNA dimethylallyltransferase